MKNFILKINRALAAKKKLFFSLCLSLVCLSAMAANDTINLATTYVIDYAQANYYTSGGQTYFTFIISNDDEVPDLRLETPTAFKTKIQGSHDVILDANLSSLTLMVESVETELTLSNAQLWLKFTGKNIDGDPEYDILAFAKASDGKYYLYRGHLPVYAYDYDNVDSNGEPALLALEDEVDDAVVEPELIVIDNNPTGINQTTNDQLPTTNKVFRDGHFFILRGDKTYTVTGQEVR